MAKYLSVLMLLWIQVISAQNLHQDEINTNDVKKDTLENYELRVKIFPYAFYTPETQFAVGGGGIILFKTSDIKELLPSKATTSFYYTTNNQYYIDLKPEVYFSGNLKLLIASTIRYSKEVKKFYGLGNETPNNDNSDYGIKTFSFSIEPQIKTPYVNNSRIGLYLEYSNYFSIDSKNNKLLNENNAAGSNESRIDLFGFSWSFDDRDNIFYPSDGNYFKVSFRNSSKNLGSGFNFNEYILDLRKYSSFFENNIIAIQFYSDFINGSPPLFVMPKLGGSNRMRGYFEGRFTDKNYLTAQFEYRRYLFWKIGIVGFASAGEVAGRFNDFKLTKTKYSYGIGLRYIFDKTENVNLRADIGFTPISTGVYFAVEEAF